MVYNDGEVVVGLEGAGVRENVDCIIEELGLNRRGFFQEDVLDLIDRPFRGVWTTIYSHHDPSDPTPSVFACLAEPQLEKTILSGVDWIKHADSFSPGFCESSNDITYINGQDDGYYYLVAEEYFHPIETGQLILSQEFILLFNLFRGNDGNYYDMNESGERRLVAKIGNEAMIRTSYLMRFIAAKQLLFVQFVDSRVSSAKRYPMNVEVIHSEDGNSDHYCYKLWFSSTPKKDYLHSMVYARSIVRPQPRETCDIWPFEHEEDYPEFPIEEKPDGTLLRFTCKPDRLNNYFGSNPGAPMYLTPVFFKPGVLDKYRKDPCFLVSERRLECGSQWGVEIDNVDSSRVMVYLGDLGRDVPEGERGHFLEYAISPADQKISNEVFANDFLNSRTDPTGPVSQLTVARRRLDETWRSIFGISLFRKPHPDDADMEKLIRIPYGDGREEFDTVILNLDKYLIEYIDESNFLGSAQTGSINKLEEFLKERDSYADLASFRDLQRLRSTSSAHAKGKKYERVKQDLLTGSAEADITTLISRLTTTLNQISDALVFDPH